MVWPIDDLTAAHLDAGTDDPKQARPELLAHINKFKTILGDPAITEVATIAALKALAVPSSALAVHVQGYYSRGDNGGGVFWWDSASGDADNGGTIITPDSAPANGRWKRIYTGGVNVDWFGAKGDASTDDFSAINKAVISNNVVELTAGKTYRVASARFAFNLDDRVLFGNGATILFDNTYTERLADITGARMTFRDVTFDANNKQVLGTLLYVADNTVRPRFIRCRFRRINGTLQGTANNNRNQQYALMISPYGVTDFLVRDCVFEDLTQDNTGAHDTATTGFGFVGGIAFTNQNWTNGDAQSTPSHGLINGVLFKNIQTILAASLSESNQIEYNDADAIRFLGNSSGATKCYVRIKNMRCEQVSKRAVKGSILAGVKIDGLDIDATGMQYPMVTAVKLDEDMHVRNVRVYADAGARMRYVFQSHDSSNWSVRGVHVDHASHLYMSTPGNVSGDYKNWLLADITVENLYTIGVLASTTCNSVKNARFENIRLYGTGNSVRGFSNGFSSTNRNGTVIRDLYVKNADVKIDGIDNDIRGLRIEVDSATMSGSGADRPLFDFGTNPLVAVDYNKIRDLHIHISDIDSAYLNATRPYLVSLHGDKLDVDGIKLQVPESLTTSFKHLVCWGHDQNVRNVEYHGPGWASVATEFAASYGTQYKRSRFQNWTRLGNGATSVRFIYTNAVQSCTIESVTDFRPTTDYCVSIASGAIESGKTYAVIVRDVLSRTGNATIVNNAGSIALVTNAVKF